MPVSVTVPTKIRIDRTALSDHPEWIEEAVSIAVGRALANSRRTVLDPRGEYLDVALHAPTFVWRGDELGGLDRARLERMVADIFRDRALTARVATPSRSDVPEVMPADPSEPYDELRGYRIAGIYSIDSYDGEKKDVPVKGNSSSDFESINIIATFTEEVPDEARVKMVSIAHKASPDHPLGVIYRFTTATGPRWQIIITDGISPKKGEDGSEMARLAGAFTFDGFFRQQFQGENASPMFKRVPWVPPPGPGTASIISVPSDSEGRKKVYKDLVESGLADTYRRHAKKPISMTTKAFDEKIHKRIDEEIDSSLSKLGSNITKAVHVTLGSADVLVWLTQQDERYLAWKGSAVLFPLETTISVPKPKKSKKSGSGEGDSGPSGGSKEGSKDGKGPSGGGSSGGGGGCCGCPPDEMERDLLKELFGDDGPSMECRPLRGEPALEEIGDAGELFGKHIAALAQKLGIPECKYAGQFCYHVASTLNDRAIATQSMAETSTGENKPSHAQQGNLGAVDFSAGTSEIISQIRDLGGVVPTLSQLIAAIADVFMSDAYKCTIHGPLRGNGISWVTKFLSDVGGMVDEAVGNMFIGACRSMILQLLDTSLDQINKRLKAIDRYAPLFERWILPQITDIAELELLHSILRNYRYSKMLVPSDTTVVTVAAQGDWLAATATLVANLTGTAVVRSVGAMYEITQEDGIDKIRGSSGVLWTWEDLEQGIALRRGLAEGIDPFVKQLTDTPEAVERFRKAASIRDELERMLKEMVSNNQEMRGKADRDPKFAFKASSITEDIPQATVPGSKYALQGIDKVAHEQIYDAFLRDEFYASGLDYLFDTEEGKAALLGFGILVGMVLLSVLVPGGAFIAFAIGGAMAIHELDKAYEKKRLYGALINPDLVLSHAEVEVGLFVAWFGLVLSLIPEGGTAVKGLVAGGRAVLKGEAKALGKMAGKAIAKRVAKELAEYAVKDLLSAFVKEMVLNVVIDQVIQKAIAPIVEEIQHESSIGFGTQSSDETVDLGQTDFMDVLRAMESLDESEDEDESEVEDDDASPDQGDDDVPYEEVIE